MRLKLQLRQEQRNQLLTFNYNYPVSSCIYRIIELSDGSYSSWLHDTGFASGKKRFKFFTFSRFEIPKLPDGKNGMTVAGNKLKILSENIYLRVSLYSEKSIENFISGMFENQKLKIISRDQEAEFTVCTIEAEPEPEYKEVIRFQTLSPVVLSRKEDGYKTPKYLSPDDPEYFDYFKKNLEEKYIALCIHRKDEIKELKIHELKILSNPSSRAIKIKEDKPDQTIIKGYDYKFELHADPEFMKIGYETGFGINNSLGFGCVSNVRMSV